ncbi:hypothetical protein ACKXGF_11145 [Alkalibacillus sp. S2W]|uniref:hypothetical protein n=1 Tax=Alkalibacillus sp. S2W TaxID=3386553 RepID=UPI00398D6177
MTIIKNEELVKRIINNNLAPIKVSDIKMSNQVYLDFDGIEGFINYANEASFKSVYYYYTYYNIEDYKIPFEWYNEYSKEFKNEVQLHNQYIESFDFDSPKSLTLFVLENGIFIGVHLIEPWLEKQSIRTADDTIEMIDGKFNEIKSQRQDDENKLRNIVINHPEFRYCKNQEIRYWFLVNLLKNEDMEKYRYLVEPYGIPHNGNIKMFMDKTWSLFKETELKS